MNCRILGCRNKVRAREVCSTHYNRMMKNGRLEKLQKDFEGQCRDCGQSKVRVRSNRRKSRTSFHYVDASNRLWNGHICPDCKNPKLIVKIKEKKRKNLIDDEFIYC